MVNQTNEQATYHIRIQGHLDVSWSDNLSGMAISPVGEQEGLQETLLTGELADQAALMGVLNTLYDMGFALISVTKVIQPIKEDGHVKKKSGKISRGTIRSRSSYRRRKTLENTPKAGLKWG